jgi:Kef-type K+ transport system membrane component KefB
MPHLEFSALTLLLAQIAAIVAVSRLLGVVTRWLGQPLVIAEVIAGIVLGPSLLGWLWPGALTALFPVASLSSLKMLSQIGLVLFMFLIGLELDPKLLKGRTHTSVAISHSSIVVPFALGAAAAWWLAPTYSSRDVPFLSFLLFLGVSMSVTAFPVLARILSERHLLTTRAGAITIACAAVDDVTAWCMLAFVVAVARAQGIAHAVWTTVFALGFIVGMLFLVRPFLRRLGTRVASREGLTPTVVAIILLLLIASSVVTELIGIHALFGAFLFGAILPKDGKLAETLVEKLETVSVVLFLPLFFAYSGLRTQIGLVSQPHEWLVTGALILVATIGKFGGSAVAARLTGLRWREASAIGILMNTRGLMELIVLNIGLDIGVISPTIFTMLVIMALVTTFATTPILRLVYPDHELARDRLVEPAVVTASEPPPFTVMMCVSDPTPGPGLATLAGALLGKRAEPARLFALHLWRPSDRPSVERRRSSPDNDDAPLRPLLNRARDLMLDVRPLEFVSAEPGADICRTAEAMHTSLVLVGAHKPLLLEGSVGGVVRDVVEGAGCPVGVFLDRGLTKVARVLMAYTGGPEDLAALRVAQRIGAGPGTSLTLLHVVPRQGGGRTPLDEVLSAEERAALHVSVVEHGSPAEAVLDEAKRGYDLVVLGMGEQWGFDTSVVSLKRRRSPAEASVSILAIHPPPKAVLAPLTAPQPRSDLARLPSA